VFSSHKRRSTFFLIWDLLNNIEVHSYEVSTSADACCCYGYDRGYHYTWREKSLTELETGLPIKFHKMGNLHPDCVFSFQNKNISRQGPLVASKKRFVISDSFNSIYNPFTYLELLYAEKVQEMVSLSLTSKSDSMPILTEFSTFAINNSNVFHMIAVNHRLLHSFKQAVEKNIVRDRTEIMKYLGLLIKNDQGVTPFDIAIANESPKCIEIQLQMLNSMPALNFGKIIDKHFDYLFHIGTTVFEEFLANCFFQNKLMDTISKVEWNRTGDEFLLANHTSFLDRTFLNKLGKTEEAFGGDEDDEGDIEEEPIEAPSLVRSNTMSRSPTRVQKGVLSQPPEQEEEEKKEAEPKILLDPVEKPRKQKK